MAIGAHTSYCSIGHIQYYEAAQNIMQHKIHSSRFFKIHTAEQRKITLLQQKNLEMITKKRLLDVNRQFYLMR
jgi:hypothetical protein